MSNVPTVIPENLPAYLQGANFGANDDAISNLSLGGFPYIKLNGTRFQVIEGDAEYAIPLLELPVVVMRAAPALRKKWYATKYNPNSVDPNKKPDCFSDDGVAPHASSTSPQAKTCAGCQHNAFGSGRDQDGKPTDGKACSDNKQLAVFSRAPSQAGAENSVFGLRLPPASLKNFALYVKSLTSKRVPLSAALTTIGFDQNSSYPVLTFKFGGLLDENQYAKINQLAQGDEAEAIIAPTPGGNAPAAAPVAAQATPAPVAAVAAPVVDIAPAPAPVAAPAPASDPLDDMFADLATKPQAEPSAVVAEVAPVAAAPAPQTTADIDMPDENDDDLAKELGLI